MALCAIGVFVNLSRSTSAAGGILTVIAAFGGLAAYLASPVMRAGSGLWLHIIVLGATLLAGIFSLTAHKKV